MGAASVCSRRIRAAAGLGDAFAGRDGREYDRGYSSSCSTSASGSGTNSDEEAEQQETRRGAAVSNGSQPARYGTDTRCTAIVRSQNVIDHFGRYACRVGMRRVRDSLWHPCSPSLAGGCTEAAETSLHLLMGVRALPCSQLEAG